MPQFSSVKRTLIGTCCSINTLLPIEKRGASSGLTLLCHSNNKSERLASYSSFSIATEADQHLDRGQTFKGCVCPRVRKQQTGECVCVSSHALMFKVDASPLSRGKNGKRFAEDTPPLIDGL